MLRKIGLWLRIFFGCHNVWDGSTCEIAATEGLPDVHDYPVCKGGSGVPQHFHTYRCHQCGHEFGL